MTNNAKPLLIAIGGLSGSGKTSLAAALQTAIPDTVHFDSDRMRKEFFGVAETTRLPPEAYTKESTQRVAAVTNRRIEESLAAGKNVVISSTFTSPDARAGKEAQAQATGATFVGMWLQAELAVLFDRFANRGISVSDATAAIIEMQVAEDKGNITWPVINAEQPREKIVSDALKLVAAAKSLPTQSASPRF